MSIRLVVFDWAGTVIDFGCFAPVSAFQEAFAQLGVPVSVAETRAPMGLHKKEHMRVMLREPGLARRWQGVHGRDSNEADIERLYAIVTPLQIGAAGRHDDLAPGLLDCVTVLRSRGIRIGGTTGYFKEAASTAAQAAARQGYLPDANICADDVPVGRPAPFMLFRVMEATGVYPASQVVKVGDTVQDIAEGGNAGAWSVGVTDSSSDMGLTWADFQRLSPEDRAARRREISDKFRAAGAHAVIASLAELPALVEALGRESSARLLQ
jgi:phosphonoacetaldehyde hydrolase